jgi:hypothetical protein
MRALADQYGVKLAVGPDRAFALSDGVAMAAYADLLILQVQRVQDEPETVRDFILPMVDAVQDAAPDVEIGVQIGAEGDVTGVISLLQSMAKEIDGISILTDHVSTDFLDAFLAEVRPPQPTPQVSAVSPTVSTVLAERERNLVTKSEVATPTLSSQLSPTSVADQPSSQEAKVDQNALSTAATPKIYADAVVVASWLPRIDHHSHPVYRAVATSALAVFTTPLVCTAWICCSPTSYLPLRQNEDTVEDGSTSYIESQ